MGGSIRQSEDCDQSCYYGHYHRDCFEAYLSRGGSIVGCKWLAKSPPEKYSTKDGTRTDVNDLLKLANIEKSTAPPSQSEVGRENHKNRTDGYGGQGRAQISWF